MYDFLNFKRSKGKYLSRCYVCDVSDVGLSDYRPDGKKHSVHFYQTPNGCMCEECYDGGEEVMQDFYDQDLESEEQEEAFEYENG